MHRTVLACGTVVLMGALTFCVAHLPLDPLTLSDWTNGTSAFWGGPQDGEDDPFNVRLPPGACGFGEQDPKMWPFFGVTGISPKNPLVLIRPQASCGTCLEVKCVSSDPKVCTTATSVTVVITDECPSCAAHELNLHAFAFQQIAHLEYGSAAIQYRQVECAPMDNITVFVDGFRVVQGGWLRLSLKSVASDGAVVRVELGRAMNTAAGNITMETAVGAGNASMATFPPEQLRAADPSSSAAEQGTDSTTNWKLMTNTYGAEWEVSGLPSPPYDLRLTDRFNRQIILPSAVTKAGALGEFPGRAQFPGLDNVTISEKAAANIKASAAMASINTLTSSEAPTLRVAPVLQIDNPAATPTKVVTHKSAPPAQGAPILKPSIVKTVSGPTRHRLLNTANPTANSITRGSTPRRRLRQGTRGQKTGPMP